MKNIVILGSTGSIGTQTLEVIEEQKDSFYPYGIVAGGNIELLAKQAKKFKPKWIGIYNENKFLDLKENIPEGIEVVAGEKGIFDMISSREYEVLVGAVSGIAGLKSTIKGIEAKKEIVLANKETLVTGGQLIIDLAKKHNISILPVDSEHSAIFQSLNKRRQLKKIILTASGGPFRDLSEDDLCKVVLEDTLKHPNWSMGKKITVDSATLANKALEVIEAHYLFNCPYENIDVLIHKESIIHSMVEFIDTSVIAQLGYPNMKLPIQYALSYPLSLKNNWKSLDLSEIGSLNFSKPKPYFKALSLGIEAGRRGGSYPIVFNGANEKAVEFFLNRRISFLEITLLIEEALEKIEKITVKNFDDIEYVDKITREFLMRRIK